MLLSCCGLLLVGTAVAFADRRLEHLRADGREPRAAPAGLAAVGAVVAMVVAIAAIGNPVDWAGDRWQDFKGDYDEAGFGSSRFSGDLGSGRYDFWRVALDDEFSESPGASATAPTTSRSPTCEHRETSEEPFYPHSLPIRLLAGTGIVGALLFARLRRRGVGRCVPAPGPGAGSAGAGSPRSRWRLRPTSASTPAATGSGRSPRSRCRSSPGSGSPVADSSPTTGQRTRLRRSHDGCFRGRRRSRSSSPLPRSWLVAVASLALPWMSARLTDSAATGWPSDPEAALSRLETARDLNPAVGAPDLVAGTIAVRRRGREGCGGGFRTGCRARADELVRAARARGPRHRRRAAAARDRCNCDRPQNLNPGRAADRHGAPPRAKARIR